MKNFSNRSFELHNSPLQDFFKRVKEEKEKGKDILSLGVGEPNCTMLAQIKKAGIKAIEDDKTRYAPASGSLALKKILAKRYGTEVDEVSVSHGAKTIIGAVMWSLLDEGDIVVIPSPCYPPFAQVAASLGAEMAFVDTSKNGFLLKAKDVLERIERLEKAPKLLIINSPNNPTGAVYEEEELKKLAELSDKFGFEILSDECYSNFPENRDFTFRQIKKDAIVVNSVSKTYAMTGIRIGWAICSSELAERVRLYLENFIGCPCSVSEEMSLEALSGGCIKDYSEQRKIIYDFFDSMQIFYGNPSGGFYVFPFFAKFMGGNSKINNSTELAEYLLKEARVAVIPGISFGYYDYSLRISYSVKVEDLKEGLRRIKEALTKIK